MSTQEKEYHRINKRNIIFNLRFAAGYHGTPSIARYLNFTFFIFISFFILYKYYNINFLKLQGYLLTSKGTVIASAACSFISFFLLFFKAPCRYCPDVLCLEDRNSTIKLMVLTFSLLKEYFLYHIERG